MDSSLPIWVLLQLKHFQASINSIILSFAMLYSFHSGEHCHLISKSHNQGGNTTCWHRMRSEMVFPCRSIRREQLTPPSSMFLTTMFNDWIPLTSYISTLTFSLTHLSLGIFASKSGERDKSRRLETTDFTHWDVIISFNLSLSGGKCGMREKLMSFPLSPALLCATL